MEAFSEPIPIEIAVALSNTTFGNVLADVGRSDIFNWQVESGENMFGLSDEIPPRVLDELNAVNTHDRLRDLAGRIKSLELAAKLPSGAYERLL